MKKNAVLISACLLGTNCRYNGTGGAVENLDALMQRAQLVPVCPEILGGLPTPRPPAERVGDRVMTCNGDDVTAQYARGAQEALKLARLFGVKYALMKERSPSCGAGEIYDGTFAHVRIFGDGVAAAQLKAAGIEVFGETQIVQLLERLKEDETL